MMFQEFKVLTYTYSLSTDACGTYSFVDHKVRQQRFPRLAVEFLRNTSLDAKLFATKPEKFT